MNQTTYRLGRGLCADRCSCWAFPVQRHSQRQLGTPTHCSQSGSALWRRYLWQETNWLASSYLYCDPLSPVLSLSYILSTNIKTCQVSHVVIVSAYSSRTVASLHDDCVFPHICWGQVGCRHEFGTASVSGDDEDDASTVSLNHVREINVRLKAE